MMDAKEEPMPIIALRRFDPLYILFDSLFLVLLAGLLIWKRKRSALVVGLLAGLLYLAVDYGFFHLVCHSRSITAGHSLFKVLLWMSLSYGFTNFVWIWLWISKDEDLLQWSTLILLWWFCCPLLTETFGGRAAPIVIQRTTGAYHGVMAALLFAGYLGAIVWNLAHRRKEEKMPLLWLLAIGILVQLGWEAGLLIGGVRSAGLTLGQSARTLVVNSLLETNLGMPYIYCIYIWYASRFTPALGRRTPKATFIEALRENNALKAGGR